MATMVGDPGDDVALRREAPGDGEPVVQGPVRLERAVREIPVEPDDATET